LSIRVALHHTTRYVYDRPIAPSPHVVRLRPAPHCRTPILAYSLKVTPAEHFLNWQQDPFGNYEARLVFQKEATELVFDVDLVADMTVVNPFDFFLEEGFEHYPFVYPPTLKRDLEPYLRSGAFGPQFAAFVERARTAAGNGRRCVDVLVDLNMLVMKSLRYDIRMEPGVFLPEETLVRGHGSCRDFAWLLVQTLRQLGLAARFVSGYSIQLKADEKPLRGPSGVERDSTDLHAWAEVFLPGAGWVGLDATSGLFAGEGHIPLACTPDPETAAPIVGSFSWHKLSEDDAIDEKFGFAMSVERVYESPRVTAPYTEEAWSEILALGRAVDVSLAAGDVRLTMGGEPTFIADSDREAPEWSVDAMGPTKRRYATDLLRRLYARFAPHGLLHEGQGKWYPGEPLPRWALTCYFRKDGLPMWHNADLFAKAGKGTDTSDDASAFVAALARELGVEPKLAVAGYEDAWYHLWRERRLPVNVDPLESKLENPTDRALLARVFEQGLASVVGYALPLRRGLVDGQRAWQSGRWFIRPERMYLMPGDSPMGYRLPLDSLPWAAPGDVETLHPPDPFDAHDPLPPPRERTRERPAPKIRAPLPGQPLDAEPTAPKPFESVPGLIRSALCVEERDGVIHVFLPPTETAEDFLELTASIEATADQLHKRIRIEGYGPPYDPRIQKLQVTPDPGVIEVNIHPAGSWDELVWNTTVLYQEAKNTELRADKFMLDGRHTGTGGGNHIVLGGATANDSPLLRRPDLLRSLVGYWLNHPSLSYLFSGMFVGPTSQSPRVDEARDDSIYELDIAFRELENNARLGGPTPPWLVDRIFRNLLIDVTGNTHRAEFCIDKLYSPDSATGRLGLLELRSFEMPPHERMSLAQQLLLRSLIAHFWKNPREKKLVRWGTSLHDRFMLPHFVEQDFCDVLDDLAAGGQVFDPAWFAPHLEFRFPTYGSVTHQGVNLEVRQALEPWHVLGEEGSAGGAVRYVDSSVERLQVKVRGMIDSRHRIACNGCEIPLHPTGVAGEFVAGVRFRAWQPPECLHPTIPTHGPLTFDIVDDWNGRSIGGCSYHVSHPGGLSYDKLPVNAFEAESRRLSRFFKMGHTPGQMKVIPAQHNAEFPLTLDLRSMPVRG
jgi:uncharacterized protein (DUF2126 family)/transglutaminase-like putative cysteine protease